ncbi:MAG: hypothetical protein F6K25_05870 [Okeania sp. SIO2G4]|uniref:hypothetical protein n=1 Tax=unclassified Okeania TaxID=2634635 RepID=UPI0013BD4570|nr:MULTISPECIES: hypothetical protein [unclassified Okeania]NEP71518.1 hypothetical protein [Okeania sp. SIO2G5]NEP92805.1 hypothetical protein [Okeania sp. SIO2F5]NEQ90273.1 hypothetical protein [Okeania sp. SIO2G4]
MAKKGHQVIATCENWPQVTELKAAAEQEGVEIEVAKMDLLNKEEREIVFEKYAEEIDILAPNAATGEKSFFLLPSSLPSLYNADATGHDISP